MCMCLSLPTPIPPKRNISFKKAGVCLFFIELLHLYLLEFFMAYVRCSTNTFWVKCMVKSRYLDSVMSLLSYWPMHIVVMLISFKRKHFYLFQAYNAFLTPAPRCWQFLLKITLRNTYENDWIRVNLLIWVHWLEIVYRFSLNNWEWLEQFAMMVDFFTCAEDLRCLFN